MIKPKLKTLPAFILSLMSISTTYSIHGYATTNNSGANLLVNGSFEEIGNHQTSPSTWSIFPSITGWHSTNNIEVWGNCFGVYAQQGNHLIEINAHNGNGQPYKVFQSFATKKGHKYLLTFHARKREANATERFKVEVCDTAKNITTHTHSKWTTYRFEFTAQSTNSTLSFTSLDGGHDTVGNLIDNVTITEMTPPNSPPVAQRDEVENQANTPVMIDVLSNDSDANNDPLTVVLKTNPRRGTAQVTESGKIHYIPKEGFTGTDYFYYKVTDGKAYSAKAKVYITVTPGVEESDNYIKNGSFETIGSSQPIGGHGSAATWQVYSSIPHWNSSSNLEIWYNGFIVPPVDGVRVLELNAHPGTADTFKVHQSFTTTPNQQYRLSFYARKREGNANEKFLVEVGDLSQMIDNHVGGQWKKFEFDFKATASSSQLMFTSLDRFG